MYINEDLSLISKEKVKKGQKCFIYIKKKEYNYFIIIFILLNNFFSSSPIAIAIH